MEESCWQGPGAEEARSRSRGLSVFGTSLYYISFTALSLTSFNFCTAIDLGRRTNFVYKHFSRSFIILITVLTDQINGRTVQIECLAKYVKHMSKEGIHIKLRDFNVLFRRLY